MAKESLIIELDARTKLLDAKLQSVDGKLEKLETQTKKNDKAFLSLSKAGEIASTGITAIATAGAAAGAAMLGATVAAVNFSRELTVAANRSGVNIEKMQELAFATKTVGISMEKLGDIGKDTNEKIGEFLVTGGGGFSDFADVMKLTKSQAKDMAAEFERLSGPDVLQEMVNQMQSAGVSTEQMSFALEGMASDTTDLIPLLKDNGAEAARLADEFKKLNVTLTQTDLNKITKLGEEITGLGAATEGASNKMVAVLNEDISAVIGFFTESADDVGAIVVGAVKGYQVFITGALAGITNLFREAEILWLEAKSTAVGLFGDNSDIEKEIAKLKEKDLFLDALGVELIGESWDKAKESVKEYYGEISDQEDQAPTVTTPSSTGGDGGGDGTGDLKSAELQAIEDSFKTESELLLQKYERDKEVLDQEVIDIEERNELKLQLKEQLESGLSDIEEKKEKEKEKEKAKQAKKDLKLSKIEDKNKKDSEKLEEQQARNSMMLAELVFKDNKEVSAGIAFVNTAQGITKALAVQDYAGAALTGVLGAAQISAILGAGKGGGSAPGVSSSGPSQSPQQTDFAPETSSLELTEQVEGEGVTTTRLIISTDDGTDIFDTFARGINENNRNGG